LGKCPKCDKELNKDDIAKINFRRTFKDITFTNAKFQVK